LRYIGGRSDGPQQRVMRIADIAGIDEFNPHINRHIDDLLD
jgi:hypothetical protein